MARDKTKEPLSATVDIELMDKVRALAKKDKRSLSQMVNIVMELGVVVAEKNLLLRS